MPVGKLVGGGRTPAICSLDQFLSGGSPPPTFWPASAGRRPRPAVWAARRTARPPAARPTSCRAARGNRTSARASDRAARPASIRPRRLRLAGRGTSRTSPAPSPRAATAPVRPTSSRYSGGALASDARPAFTPSAYDSMIARSSSRRGGHHAPRDVAEAMHADLAVRVEDRRPDHLGQLAGRIPPQQVHLEEAILPVHKAGGKRQIEPVLGVDRGDAQLVAFDAHRRGQPGDLDLTVQLGQAARPIGCESKARRQCPPAATPRTTRRRCEGCVCAWVASDSREMRAWHGRLCISILTMIPRTLQARSASEGRLCASQRHKPAAQRGTGGGGVPRWRFGLVYRP